MSEVNLIAVITPAQGKVDRVAELLKGMCSYVTSHEPETLMYQMHKSKGDNPEFIVVEKYKDDSASQKHANSEAFQNFVKTVQEEKLLAKEMQLYFTDAVAGFHSR